MAEDVLAIRTYLKTRIKFQLQPFKGILTAHSSGASRLVVTGKTATARQQFSTDSR
jgi:hypothetical protein